MKPMQASALRDCLLQQGALNKMLGECTTLLDAATLLCLRETNLALPIL